MGNTTFSDKQIKRAVERSFQVLVRVSDHLKVEGWIYGADDYHWGVVDADGDTVMVHKSASMIAITNMSLYGAEANGVITWEKAREIAAILEPFRKAVREGKAFASPNN